MFPAYIYTDMRSTLPIIIKDQGSIMSIPHKRFFCAELYHSFNIMGYQQPRTVVSRKSDWRDIIWNFIHRYNKTVVPRQITGIGFRVPLTDTSLPPSSKLVTNNLF